jgi:hypothetical protein
MGIPSAGSRMVARVQGTLETQVLGFRFSRRPVAGTPNCESECGGAGHPNHPLGTVAGDGGASHAIGERLRGVVEQEMTASGTSVTVHREARRRGR